MDVQRDHDARGRRCDDRGQGEQAGGEARYFDAAGDDLHERLGVVASSVRVGWIRLGGEPGDRLVQELDRHGLGEAELGPVLRFEGRGDDACDHIVLVPHGGPAETAAKMGPAMGAQLDPSSAVEAPVLALDPAALGDLGREPDGRVWQAVEAPGIGGAEKWARELRGDLEQAEHGDVSGPRFAVGGHGELDHGPGPKAAGEQGKVDLDLVAHARGLGEHIGEHVGAGEHTPVAAEYAGAPGLAVTVEHADHGAHKHGRGAGRRRDLCGHQHGIRRRASLAGHRTGLHGLLALCPARSSIAKTRGGDGWDRPRTWPQDASGPCPDPRAEGCPPGRNHRQERP